jgi:hypothetical protein
MLRIYSMPWGREFRGKWFRRWGTTTDECQLLKLLEECWRRLHPDGVKA